VRTFPVHSGSTVRAWIKFRATKRQPAPLPRSRTSVLRTLSNDSRTLATFDVGYGRAKARGEPRRCSRVVSAIGFRSREIVMECVMRRKIGTAVAAFVLLSGSSLISFAQTGGSPSAGERGVVSSPKAEGIGGTSSTHNPSGSSSSATGMENRTATGSDMGTDTSTHNPGGKKD
jgi:hypothetical protein